MALELGILFALLTMVAWGFGDFLIQKSTRKIGVWGTMFFITFTGFLALTPFVLNTAISLFTVGLGIFLAAGAGYCLAGLLDLEALKEGKLDIVEPIWAFEIVSSAILALVILHESLSYLQIAFIVILTISLSLLSLKNPAAWAKRSKPRALNRLGKRLRKSKSKILEKGVLVAFVSAISMGVANFLIGLGSRAIDPVTMKWGLDLFLAAFSLPFVLRGKGLGSLLSGVKKSKKRMLAMTLFDNTAWLSFGIAMVLAPISIAVAVSESYIIIAVLLGIFVNKERLKKHQAISLVIALLSAIYLAYSISGL